MDLGCLDLGCIEKRISQSSHDSEQSPHGSNSKSGKNKAMKDSAQSNMGVLNKSQFKKPPHRKTSPLNWFPRMKVDSYLKRKIKLLQEVGGMNSTLDETLGDSNPHYPKVLREKIAVSEAAHKAMEARKAALVEASWCRILKAAMIECKEAEALLLKAEKSAAEAFEAANAIGVVMYDIPDCPGKYYEIETSVGNGEGSSTHTIRASFETAFDVDKQVAAAVKTAFIKLASCSSVNKDEFKELLRKISQNPDGDECSAEMSELSSECESDVGSDLESGPPMDSFSSSEIDLTKSKQIKCKKMAVSEKFSTFKLVDMMLQRLRCLQEEELASLATIVATCGLNAALAESETSTSLSSIAHGPRRMSSYGEVIKKNVNMDGHTRRKQVEAEIPSLDKFLVKHVTRLEREVQEAKNARKNEEEKLVKRDGEKDVETTGLGSVFVKRGSKFEKDIEEAKKNSEEMFFKGQKNANNEVVGFSEAVPDLGTFLTRKHTSKLEREIEESKRKCGKSYEAEVKKEKEVVPDLGSVLTTKHTSKLEKEIEETKKKNGKSLELKGKKSERIGHKKQEATDIPSLDQCLVKHVSKLEKEVKEATNRRNMELPEKVIFSTIVSENSSLDEVGDQNGKENINMNTQMDKEDSGKKEKLVNTTFPLPNSADFSGDSLTPYDTSISEATRELSLQDEKNKMKETKTSLDKILVKPVHMLEREKLESLSSESYHIIVKQKSKYGEASGAENYESLDKVLVKHVSKLEKEKMAVGDKNEEVVKKINRRDVNSQLDHSEGSLDQILIKHKSRLEREKIAASSEQPTDQMNHRVLARKEARQRNLVQLQESEGSLDQILVKHKSRLEREKVAAVNEQQNEQMKNPLVTRKEARERELQEAWGGLSFGNSMQPRLSRLQRDKAAWLKAEEEERMRASEEV